MATLTAPTYGVTYPKAKMGQKYREFALTDVGDSDTLDIGFQIADAAWKGTGVGDAVVVTFSGSTLTFNAAGTETGTVCVWSER